MPKGSHRTQITLGALHYEYLRRRSAKEGKSISQLIRDMVSEAMTETPAGVKDPLFELGQGGFKGKK